MSSSLIIRLAVQLVIVAALARISGYPRPDFSDANWSTVLFLTPIGIIQNHLTPSTITSFYGELTKGQGGMLSVRMVAFYLALVFNAVVTWRSLREP